MKLFDLYETKTTAPKMQSRLVLKDNRQISKKSASKRRLSLPSKINYSDPLETGIFNIIFCAYLGIEPAVNEDMMYTSAYYISTLKKNPDMLFEKIQKSDRKNIFPYKVLEIIPKPTFVAENLFVFEITKGDCLFVFGSTHYNNYNFITIGEIAQQTMDREFLPTFIKYIKNLINIVIKMSKK